MKRVVSVSLGSSKRDKSSSVVMLNEEFEVSRIGTDGDMKRFAELIRELDGKIDAIGLGGIDRYFYVDDKRYTIRDADRLAKNAHITPVVDGSGIKNTLERKTIEYLQENKIVDFAGSNILVVSAVDRFGMAQAIAKVSDKVIYGDLMFSMGIPIPMRSYKALRFIGNALLPIVVNLPFQWIYPTGEKQEIITPKFLKYFEWADVIVGDYHLIKKNMPTKESGLLAGKTIVSNTLTSDDTDMLKDRQVKMIATSTPEYDGRYYATNVFEAMLITLLKKKPEDVKIDDYEKLLKETNWKPTITFL